MHDLCFQKTWLTHSLMNWSSKGHRYYIHVLEVAFVVIGEVHILL